jgi:hypothetical protein
MYLENMCKEVVVAKFDLLSSYCVEGL